jgi:hypothetical protein
MAQTNNTILQLYYSTTASAVPSGANLSYGELALNVVDGKLYFKDSTNTVSILASTAGSAGTVQSVAVTAANGFNGTVSNATTNANITLSTTITGILKGNGTAMSAATAGTDYAPATSGSSILSGNGSGGFSNVTVGTNLSFAGGTLNGTGAPATTGTDILYGNGSGGFSSVTVASPLTFSSGTLGLAPITTGSDMLKGDGAGGITNAVPNVDFVPPGANTSITSVALTSGTITTAPASSTDIVNKSYVDALASGINFHAACQYATTVDLGSVNYNNGSSGVGATLTNAGTQAALVIDGHTFTALDVTNGVRVLVKDESNAAYNGVYVVSNQGSGSTNWVLTRAADYDTPGTGVDGVDQGDLVLVIYGTTNDNTSWVQQTPLPIVMGTTPIVFVEFAAVQTYNAGTGLSLTTNTFSITNIGTAGTYGSATQTPVLTTNAQGQVTSVTDTTITPAVGSITGLGTGTATALAVNVGSAGAFVTNGGALGTPSSGVLTNATGLPVSTGISGLGAGVATALAVSTSSSGSFVINGGALGTPSSGTLTNCTFPTLNQNTTGSAGSVATTNWTVVESGGKLYFKYGGVNKGSLDSTGNFIVTGNVTAYGTP